MMSLLCQLLMSVPLILSEHSCDGSTSFLRGSKEPAARGCVCVVEVVFL